MSELRLFLAKFHPKLYHLICNIRGIEYSLPLYLKDPEIYDVSCKHKISNKKLQDIVSCFETYAQESIVLSKRCLITKADDGFILQRKPVHTELSHLLEHYEKQMINYLQS